MTGPLFLIIHLLFIDWFVVYVRVYDPVTLYKVYSRPEGYCMQEREALLHRTPRRQVPIRLYYGKTP